MFVSDNGIIADEYKRELEAESIPFEENKHSEEKILVSQIIIKSPGIPFTVPVVQKALERGVRVIDEIEFAAHYTTAKIIAITGTNGKTTTTLLTYHLLKEAGLKVGLAGNIGHSLAKQVIEDRYEFYVVEISSFQLESTYTFKPYVGVILNITPDHMDRYEYKLRNYVNAKFKIVENMDQADHFIYFKDNHVVRDKVADSLIKANIHAISLEEIASAHLENEDMVFEVGAGDALKINLSETVLKGKHNAINMMAAVKSALICGVDDSSVKEGLKTFQNAPHRLEYVTTINNVEFVNDSKATNVDAVGYALDSFSQSLVWIAGGVDKGNNYDLIMEMVNEKVKALVCLGKDNSKLRDAFHEQIINLLETGNMKDAVRSAMNYASEHDVVLLSPACASFDLFNNYEDRGEQFKAAVWELKQEFENHVLS